MSKSDPIWNWALPAVLLAGLMTWLVLQPAQPRKEKSSGPEPQLKLARDSHDFGTVMAGQKVTQRFKIRNTGDAPLILGKISASCSCTVPHVERKRIQPDGAATITAELTVKTGKNTQSIYIESNDPGQARSIIRLHAEGIATVLLDPPGFDFGELRLGQTSTNTIRMTAGDGRPFALMRPTLPELPGIEAALEARPVEPNTEGRAAGWDVSLIVTPREHHQPEIDFSPVIHTDHPLIPAREINSYLALRHPLQWQEKPRHFLGVAHPGESRQTSLILASDSNSSFKIIEAAAVHGDIFKVETEPIDEGRRHRLILTAALPSDIPQGFQATRLNIRTDLPAAHTLEPSFSIHVIPR
ncbi:MAG: hypothetical protein CMO74_11130 [Verrucomicrobiales bacterium]|nr:hypothetical protein [Verrucomicrobiales bacterium]|tara:strand:- start:73396 stop:74463 length:1068 start_codon:yes stop_codon:yes gene_type:complete